MFVCNGDEFPERTLQQQEAVGKNAATIAFWPKWELERARLNLMEKQWIGWWRWVPLSSKVQYCFFLLAAAFLLLLPPPPPLLFLFIYFFTRQRRYSDDVVNTNKDYKTYYPLFSMVSTPVQIEYTEYYYAVCR